MRSFFFSAFVFAAVSVAALRPAHAENLPLDHPAAELVKTYLTAVVNQDWATAGGMLSTESLQKKLEETVSIIKMAPTMTEETAMLAKLGVKELSSLEEMDARAFYAAERSAVHERLNIAPEVLVKKKETLKIDVIGLAGENGDEIVHAIVRTNQETLSERINELFLISMQKLDDGTGKYVIVPDMMRPTTEKLGAAE